MPTSSNSSNTRPAPSHLERYPARLLRPLLMHPFNGGFPNRTAPGGSIVDVMENTEHVPGEVTRTAMVTMDGVLYARDLKADGSQFSRLT